MELQVQGNRKKTEGDRIGKQPESDHDKLVNDCYSELIAVAKDIGKVKQIKGLSRTDPKEEGGG